MAGRSANLRSRAAQFGRVFSHTRANDPKFVPLLAGISGAVLVVCLVLGVVFDRWLLGLLVGLALAILAGLMVFGQRASAAAFGSIRGQPGAAAAVLQSMRGPWRLTPAVAVTRKQDLVHRVVGRPGVILVGEGSPARVTTLLKQERRRVARVVGDVPVHEIRVGQGDGAVDLDRLRSHLMRLPRAIKPRAVGPLETRLAALSDTDLPVPKGPLPRPPRGKYR